jgi:hypothetical protein
MSSVPNRLPLPTLLSFALVAYTIEFDNEAEHRLPHRTTSHGVTSGSLPKPWLASLVMWENCLRHLSDHGLSVRELEQRARTPTNLAGMERWRYVSVAPDPADPRPEPPRSAWIIRPTAGGRIAQEIWRPLAAEIETDWQQRFGVEALNGLRESLRALDEKLDPRLPECLPILKYSLFSAPPDPKLAQPDHVNGAPRPLYALLSRVLIAFAIEFEAGFVPSLAVCANLLRILDDKGVRVRDLPLLSGVSKEGLQMAFGIVRKSRLAVIEDNPEGGPFKVARLTAKGLEARQAYRHRLAGIEGRWIAHFGAAPIARLRTLLEEIAGQGTAVSSPLFKGLEPYPDGWRASVRKPSTLPHFPMVLHRGGFPDGS